MKLFVTHQDRYSRGELLLRTFFGWLYIALPHGFILMFLGIWGAILQFVAFWVILFTGKYPESMFAYQLDMMRWNVRLSARLYNLADGYPAFGLKSADNNTGLEVSYPEQVNRGLTLIRLLFGWLYVGIPHGFLLTFRALWVFILMFAAWWVVLFTAAYPKNYHQWVVGQIRWQIRVNLYLMFMTDAYPAFTGDEVKEEAA